MINQVTIRVVNKVSGKVKNVFPAIANNKQLMKSSGFEISDPQYDAKMEAVKNNRPFIENGKSKEPVKDSFAIQNEKLLDKAFDSKTELGDKVEAIKEYLNNEICCNDNNIRQACKPIYVEPTQAQQEFLESIIENKIGKSIVEPIKPKRTRRTKEQMKQSKLQK